jgi:hypothetical protein
MTAHQLEIRMKGVCFCCGKKGHKSPACRLRNRPKQEWAINKTSENIQAQNVMTSPASQEGRSDNNATTSITSTSTSNNAPYPWTGAQVSRSEFSAVQGNAEMRNWVLLDSQSTVDLFCNPKLVTDIKEEDEQ